MTRYAVDWVDAFSDRPFGGNGCAVVHDGAVLDVETSCAFVREPSLTECTFTGPSDVADFRVRYFLASREVGFAGHPTLATAAALRHRGLIGDKVTFETGAGIVPVEIAADGTITMTQVAPRFGATADPALVAAAFGLPAEAVLGTPQVVSTGMAFCVTVLRDRAALEAARIDRSAWERLHDALGHSDPPMEEPFLVTLEGATAQGDTHARLLITPPSPPEDPFTGSATGAMASYLWHHGLIDLPDFVAEQGHIMGRPGQAQVAVLGPRDAIQGVRVGGKAHVLMTGALLL